MKIINHQAMSGNIRAIGVLAIVLLCLILLASCQRNREHHAELFVFGTMVEIKLWGATQEQSDRAFAELQHMFNGMHRDWHAWEPAG